MGRLTRIPTVRGDVLVLVTTASFAIHAVASVTHDDQQDFSTEGAVTHEAGLVAAMKRARSLVTRGHSIYLSNIDTGEWKLISAEAVSNDFRSVGSDTHREL